MASNHLSSSFQAKISESKESHWHPEKFWGHQLLMYLGPTASLKKEMENGVPETLGSAVSLTLHLYKLSKQ